MPKLSARSNALIALSLGIVFLFWLIFLTVSPIAIHPDSGGYQQDADHIFEHGYSTFRPMLFPLFLKLADAFHIKLSLAAFFVNSASVVCLAWMAGGKKQLFSGGNMLVMLVFFLCPAFWSFSGAKLSESILLAVGTWIFIFLVEIYFPQGKTSTARTVILAIGACLLANLYKPWIMLGIFMIIGLLLVASFVFASFRNTRTKTLILLGIAVIIYGISFKYNMSKSPTSANMVQLMCETGTTDLKVRLAAEKDTASDKAVMLRKLITDIDFINSRYHGDPFAAPRDQVYLCRYWDKDYQKPIKKAFVLAYFRRPADLLNLIGLDLSVYFGKVYLGWGCLQNNADDYGPNLPWFRTASAIGMLLVVALVLLQVRGWRSENPGKKAAPAPTIFFWSVMIAGFFFALFLCIAGGIEQGRTALPAILFQLLALTWYLRSYPRSVAGQI